MPCDGMFSVAVGVDELARQAPRPKPGVHPTRFLWKLNHIAVDHFAGRLGLTTPQPRISSKRNKDCKGDGCGEGHLAVTPMFFAKIGELEQANRWQKNRPDGAESRKRSVLRHSGQQVCRHWNAETVYAEQNPPHARHSSAVERMGAPPCRQQTRPVRGKIGAKPALNIEALGLQCGEYRKIHPACTDDCSGSEVQDSPPIGESELFQGTANANLR